MTGPVDHTESLRNVARLEELAAHAVVQGHNPRQAVRVAEGWMASTARAAYEQDREWARQVNDGLRMRLEKARSRT